MAGLWAQTHEVSLPSRFLHFSIADGLPSNGIRTLSTDAEGFVWIGTLSGVARWDGHRIVAFNDLVAGDKLPEGDVKLLFCDSHGALWIKYLLHPGLYRLDLSTYQISRFQQDFFQSKEAFPPKAVEDAAGDIWFATTKGLSVYRWKAQTFDFFPLVYEGAHQKAVQVCVTPDGKLWVGTQRKLFVFDPQRGTCEAAPLFDKDEHIHVLACDAEGHLWIGRWYDDAHGVVEYDPVRRQVLRTFNKKGGAAGGFLSTELTQIYPDGNRIWFCSNEGGLVVLDKKQNTLRRFEPNDLNPASVSTWTVFSIVRDKFGNYWVGTESALDFLPTTDKTALLFARNPYNAQSLSFSKTNTVAALSNGNMVFGTDRGLSLYSPRQNTWRTVHLPLFNGTSYNDVVLSVAEQDATRFWVGTWEGLYLMNSNTGALEQSYTPLQTPHRLLRDRRGFLWISYNGRPVQRWRAGKFESIDTLSNDGNDLNDRVNCFVEQDGERLFLGTSDGLVRYEAQRQLFQNVPVSFPGETGPIKIISLCLARSGLLYMVANDRVFSLDIGQNASTATPINFSFPLNNCLDLLEDDQGDLWVCAESGLARYRPKRAESFFFGARGFLQGNAFSTVWWFNKSAKGLDGKLYFAGILGISVLRPDVLAGNAAPPVAKITGLKINNQTAMLDSVVHRFKRLTLDWWQNNLSFDFSALGSSLPALNRYAYQLVPEKFWRQQETENWVELGEQSTVHFSNLPSGSYHLQVRAANSDGVWCERPATLHIVISPPWYRTGWASLCGLLVLCGGIYLFYHYQLSLRLRHAETIRLKELDRFKSQFFTNITHEFRTPLTVMLGMTDRLLGDGQTGGIAPSDTRTPLMLIKRNGLNLLRLINEILDLAKLEHQSLKINYVQGDVVAYLRYIAESLHSLANAKDVMLRVASEQTTLLMDYDPDRLLQIVHNLLANAIKFTPSGGRVTLGVGTTAATPGSGGPARLRLTVVDTGTGIPPENLPHIFERFFQTPNQARHSGGSGIGLSLTHELVKAMGGEITVESTLGKGSCFTVQLPITRKAEAATTRTTWMPPLEYTATENMPAAKLAALAEHTLPADCPTLLLIEDNPDVVEYLVGCLSPYYRLDFSYNGRAGIEKGLETVPDLILSDVMMPEKDGFEVCDTLKNDERTSHIPIVLLTARADMESRIAGLKRGADAYLAKPFHPEELLVTLSNLNAVRARLQARYASGQVPATPSEDKDTQIEDAFLQKVRAVVMAHLSDTHFEMPQLERALAMSRSQIFRKLKALTGQSPSLFIRGVRLAEAQKLLAGTSMTVSEIAYETGFSSPQYFSDAFLEVFGQRPSATRN